MVWLHLFSDLVWRTICVLRGSRDRACKKLCNASWTTAWSCARSCSNSRACTRWARKHGCSMGTFQTQPLSDIFTVIRWNKELRSLKVEKQQLQQKCELQEQTLQEMGLHLSQSVLLSLLFINSRPLLVFMVLSFLLKVQTKDGGL